MLVITISWLSIIIIKMLLTLRVIAKKPPVDTQERSKNVTLLQPILSGDPNLAAMLEANVCQLQQAGFIWLIDDDDRVAQEVVSCIKCRYPDRDIRVKTFPVAPEGVNPKVFKLEQAWREVQSDVVLVLDDDAQLSADALAQLLSEVKDGVLVTALPYYANEKSFFSVLLAQFVNDNSAQTYLPLLPYMPPLTINGMCYALTKNTLVEVTGFIPIQRHLTDDLALASLLEQHQVTLIQSTALVKVRTAVPSSKKYIQQMHRWFLFATLLLKEKSLKINVLIFILQGLHPLLLWMLLVLGFSHPWVLCSCLIIRQLTLRKVQQALTTESKLHPIVSLISELLQPIHLLHALIVRTIVWRTRRYRVFSNKKFISQ